MKTYESQSCLQIQFVLKNFCTFYWKICIDASCLVKGWLSFVSWGVTINRFMIIFMMYWRRISMNLLHWMLILLALAFTLPTKVLANCMHLVAQWHLPSPPFASMQDGWWGMWRAATWYIRYLVINFLVGQWLGLTLELLTSLSHCYIE